MDIKTTIRLAEAFIVILIVNFASLITIGGQALDLSTPEGRSTALSAAISAIILAARRAWASPSTSSS